MYFFHFKRREKNMPEFFMLFGWLKNLNWPKNLVDYISKTVFFAFHGSFHGIKVRALFIAFFRG